MAVAAVAVVVVMVEWRKCRLGRYGCFSTRGLCHSGRVAFIKYDVVLNPNDFFFFFLNRILESHFSSIDS